MDGSESLSAIENDFENRMIEASKLIRCGKLSSEEIANATILPCDTIRDLQLHDLLTYRTR